MTVSLVIRHSPDEPVAFSWVAVKSRAAGAASPALPPRPMASFNFSPPTGLATLGVRRLTHCTSLATRINPSRPPSPKSTDCLSGSMPFRAADAIWVRTPRALYNDRCSSPTACAEGVFHRSCLSRTHGSRGAERTAVGLHECWQTVEPPATGIVRRCPLNPDALTRPCGGHTGYSVGTKQRARRLPKKY